MFASIFWIGLVVFLIGKWLKNNYDESPGSKNWVYSIDNKISGIEEEMSSMEYMHNLSSDSKDRIERVERDLERMNAIINMYKEWANIHKEEHKNFEWTKIIR